MGMSVTITNGRKHITAWTTPPDDPPPVVCGQLETWRYSSNLYFMTRAARALRIDLKLYRRYENGNEPVPPEIELRCHEIVDEMTKFFSDPAHNGRRSSKHWLDEMRPI